MDVPEVQRLTSELHAGQDTSSASKKGKRIEQVFGWGKTVDRTRLVIYRGLERVDHLFVLMQVGYNLTRMRTLAD